MTGDPQLGARGAADPPPGPAAVPWDVDGPEDAPPIVFVHGALMSRAMWQPQIDSLQARHRCVRVDLPGHGVLDRRGFDMDDAVEGVRRAIDEAAGGRAVLVGLSLGGYVAMTAAARHPERVRGLVIAGSSAEPAGVTRLAFLLYGWALRLSPPSPLRVIAFRWFRRRYGAAVAAAITAGGFFVRGGGAAVRALAGKRFRDRLLAYGGPILVVNGTLDLVFRLNAGRFVAGVPGVTSRVVRGAAHLSNVDRPAEFNRLIEDFVASLPA